MNTCQAIGNESDICYNGLPDAREGPKDERRSDSQGGTHLEKEKKEQDRN